MNHGWAAKSWISHMGNKSLHRWITFIVVFFKHQSRISIVILRASWFFKQQLEQGMVLLLRAIWRMKILFVCQCIEHSNKPQNHKSTFLQSEEQVLIGKELPLLTWNTITRYTCHMKHVNQHNLLAGASYFDTFEWKCFLLPEGVESSEMLILMSLVLCSFLLVWCLGFVKAFPRNCA